MRFKLALLLLLGSGAGAAAGESYEVSVEAVCLAAGGQFYSYRLVGPGPGRGPDSDAARDVRTALSGCGLYEAPAGVAPDLTIDLSCGLGEPRREVRSEDVIVPDGSLSTPFSLPSATLYVTVTRWVNVFPKYLTLSARSTHSAEGVWRIRVSITDESSEIEPLIPVLAAAAMNVVGRDTQGTTTLELAADDADIAFILAGMTPSPF